MPTPYISRLAAGALVVLLPRLTTAQQAADGGAFVTRLGADTLVVERFTRSGGRVTADVLVRTPRTARTRYTVEVAPDGGLRRMEAVAVDPRSGAPLEGAAVARQLVTRVGDSLRVETVGPAGGEGGPAAPAGVRLEVRTVAADPAALPFIDLVHWPFELALQRARRLGATEAAQPLLTGARVSVFRLATLGRDSMTITHPSRGTMRARVDASGRLLGLDAGATTRKLRVERVARVDVDALAARWASMDATGRSVGALSGRGADTASVGGATLTVDYGTPARRGRAIWGALVPFGAVWRTGANEATHFTTTRDLRLGSGADTLLVPAGRYTLFSVPERGGGQLIVNRQTGQTGTAYDAARDLGRVPLAARPLAAPVEVFTIRMDGEASGAGTIRLQWDRTELTVPFTVR